MDSGELNTDEKNALQALNGTIESLLEKTTESGSDTRLENKPEQKPVQKPQIDKTEKPKTGDTEPVMMWILLTAAGAAGVVGCII